MKIKAVIFDLDGTILDTLEDLAISVNHALKEGGFPERSFEEIRSFVGNGALRLMVSSLPEGSPDEEVQQTLDRFNAHYHEHCEDHTGPYPGITEMLKELRDKDVLTAVLSNKPDYGVQTLCKNHFPDLFDIVAGQIEGIKIKPAPDSVFSVLRAFDVSKEEVVYIGDSEVDIKTCMNAGIRCICVDWGFRDKETLEKAGAETIFSSVDELKKELFAITGGQ